MLQASQGQMVMLLVFAFTIAALITEKYHRVVSALLGAALAVYFGSFVYGLFSAEEAVSTFIHGPTMRLILGVLLLMEGLARSGLFQFVGLWIVRLVGGSVKLLFVSFIFLSTFLTLLIPNLPAMLIIGAITASVAKQTPIRLRKWIVYEAIACNAGSIGLMISSIPNLIIASEFGFMFSDFLTLTTPLALLLTGVTTIIGLWTGGLTEDGDSLSVEVDPWKAVKSRWALVRSATIFTVFVGMLAMSDRTGIPMDIVALMGSVAMLWLGGAEPEEVLRSLDWGTFFFLAGFYVLVGAEEKVGVLDLLATSVAPLYRLPGPISASATLWISGLASGLVDNIPITLTLIPIVRRATQTVGVSPTLMAWALAIGANLGGSLTYFASPPSLVAVSILEREDRDFTPWDFMKIGAPLTFLHLALADVYLLIRLTF